MGGFTGYFSRGKYWGDYYLLLRTQGWTPFVLCFILQN